MIPYPIFSHRIISRSSIHVRIAVPKNVIPALIHTPKASPPGREDALPESTCIAFICFSPFGFSVCSTQQKRTRTEITMGSIRVLRLIYIILQYQRWRFFVFPEPPSRYGTSSGSPAPQPERWRLPPLSDEETHPYNHSLPSEAG